MKDQRGFTLIELMVVLSVTAILGIIGIAGFTTYNNIQTLQSATNDVATMINLAKSRARSQIKPLSICGTSGVLDGYKVKVSSSEKKYTLNLRCSGRDILIEEATKTLPSDLSFGADTEIFFPVQTGTVQVTGANPIVISASGQNPKKITVSSLGGISVR